MRNAQGRAGKGKSNMRAGFSDMRRLVRPAVMFGISFYIVFTVVSLQYPTLQPAGGHSAVFLGISVLGLANALTFLAIALLFLWRRIVIGGRYYRLVLGALLAIGVLSGLCAESVFGVGSVGTLAMCIAADALVGIVAACLGVEWVRVLSAFPSRQVAVNAVVSVIVSVPLLLIGGMASNLVMFLGFALAEASIVLLWRCAAHGARMAKSGLKSGIHVPWKLVVTIMLQGMSTGAVHSAAMVTSGEVFLPVEATAFVLASVVALAGLLVFRLDFNHLLYMVGFPLMACGQMLLALFGAGDMVGMVVHETGYRFIMVLSWVLAAWVIRHNDLSANWVWPCFMCSFVFGRILGSLLGGVPAALFALPPSAVVAIVMVFALLLGALLLFGSVNLDTGWDMASVEPVSQADVAMSAFDRACETVARDYRLTPRETEIFQQLARGRNQEYIGEYLHVSKDTVKTHRKNVYRKLDIHSQQDLMSLVEQTEASLSVDEEGRAEVARVVM